MTGRLRILLPLLLAMLMALAQQAGVRHLVSHAGDLSGMGDSANGFARAPAAVDAGERGKACPDCLAFLGLGGVAGTAMTAQLVAAAIESRREAPDRSIPNPPPTARGQGPPVRS